MLKGCDPIIHIMGYSLSGRTPTDHTLDMLSINLFWRKTLKEDQINFY